MSGTRARNVDRQWYRIRLLKSLDDGPPKVITTFSACGYSTARQLATALVMNPLDPYDATTAPDRLSVNVQPILNGEEL